MEVLHKMVKNVLVISPQCDTLDANVASNFKEKVLDIITNQNQNNILLDLNQFQFMDSSGLGCLLSLLRFVNTRGGKLRLCQINRPIKTMFELVSMQKIFDLFPTVEEGVQSFS